MADRGKTIPTNSPSGKGRLSQPNTLISDPVRTDDAALMTGWLSTRPAPFVPLAVVGAIVFAIGPLPIINADAAAIDASGQLFPIQSIHNTPIAGPMVAGQALGWQPLQQDLVRLPQAGDVGFAAPFNVTAAAAINWWDTRSPDAVRVAPVLPSLLAQPVTVPTTPSVNWWDTRSPNGALAPPVVTSQVAAPLFGSSTLPWLLRGAPSILLPPPVRSVIAIDPIPSIAASADWWQTRTPDPVRLPPPIASTLAAPVILGPGAWYPRPPDPVPLAPPIMSTLAAPIILGPGGWLPRAADPVRPLIFIQSSSALPLPNGSTLPWLVSGLPLVAPPYPLRSIIALNPTTPAAQTVVMPWLVPPGALVFAPVARSGAVYAKPMPPFTAGGSNLPWLLTGAPLVRASFLIQSSLALNPNTPLAQVVLPWPAPMGPGRIAMPGMVSLLVQPVGVVGVGTGTIYRVPVEEFYAWQRPVTSFLGAPPVSPVKGDRYVVAVGATGSWAGQDNAIAWCNGTSWLFDTPGPGWGVFNIADSTLYFLIGGVWTPY